MTYVIGIDTGGTYTDAVLLNACKRGVDRIERKSKAFTTHHNLEYGIRNSIGSLNLTCYEIDEIDKVVLSTTLATNAIVEGKIYRTGLILIGDRPRGGLATEFVQKVNGSVNIKGSVLLNIHAEEVKKAVEELIPNVDSIAVSGLASVRNPILEQRVKEIINGMCEMPVVCGHELVNDLGFLERTNTAVINAGLLPTINNFVRAIKSVLKQQNIRAPVFVVKGDGSTANIDMVKNTPVDTVLSGPASSIIGAINLTEIDDTIVVDMGGTTTDIGIVRKKRVELTPDGAVIGNWKIRIKSAKLYTFGLGGDSRIELRNGVAEVGPDRVLPACRGGKDVVTPTDILHYTNEYVEWSRANAVSAVEKHADRAGITPSEYVNRSKDAIATKIYENLSDHASLNLPISAIGAPAESWYHIAKEKYGFNVVIPNHYEVANAVGAATAGINVEVEAIIRPGEEGYGFLVHTKSGRYAFRARDEALNKAIEITKECAVKMITDQNLELDSIFYFCEDMYSNKGQLIRERLCTQSDGQVSSQINDTLGQYVGTQVKVMASGKIFAAS